ncbi:MAG: aminotransferase class V-fold PLP-dependent enzyme [Planctomycetia bacterium]|nr:aminotransferase class V-fold PLP-dependent enzyme [Planctomycetia bacterium]
MTDVDDDAWREIAAQWSIAPGVTYLNHGSFGPPPRPLLEAREVWLRRVAGNPMEYLTRGIEQDRYLGEARQSLASLVGCSSDDLAFVENSTVGMNIVANSFSLSPGDRVLATDHEYGAVLRLWEGVCAKAGAQLIVRSLSYPIENDEALVAQLFAECDERTKLLIVSHVTSPTAVVLPLERICAKARRRGIAVCVDGPHAIAMREVNLQSLDCDFYVASLHKWLCAPFGTGFLYVHPRRQDAIRPLVISWGRTPPGVAKSWRDEFFWLGTRDPTGYLCVPAAIEFLANVGWERFRERTHQLAKYAKDLIVELTGLPPFTPDDVQWYGSMIALPLPDGDAPSLQRELVRRYGIEIPIIPWQGRRFVRPSCHLYTKRQHLEQLRDALHELLAEKH